MLLRNVPSCQPRTTSIKSMQFMTRLGKGLVPVTPKKVCYLFSAKYFLCHKHSTKHKAMVILGHLRFNSVH